VRWRVAHHPADAWKPEAAESDPANSGPAGRVIGLPYSSSRPPVLMHTGSAAPAPASLLRLYALSTPLIAGAGQLSGLFRTHFTRKAQATLWGWDWCGMPSVAPLRGETVAD